MSPKFSARFTFEEYDLRIKDAIAARRAWIDTIADHPMDHHLVSCKWTVFVDLVRLARVTMAEFEQNLKAMNPDEYNYVKILPTIGNGK
jgi:hypothetical protein